MREYGLPSAGGGGGGSRPTPGAGNESGSGERSSTGAGNESISWAKIRKVLAHTTIAMRLGRYLDIERVAGRDSL